MIAIPNATPPDDEVALRHDVESAPLRARGDPPPLVPGEDGVFAPGELLSVLRHSVWLMLLLGVAGVVAAHSLMSREPERYTAKALIRVRGRANPIVVSGAADLARVLPDVLEPGDLLLMMGAGDIGHAAQHIAAQGFEGASA